MVGQSRLGQPYSAPGTAEQLDVKEFFEIGDLPAYRALGQGQFLGGPGKALMAGGGLEADQGLGGGYLAAQGGILEVRVCLRRSTLAKGAEKNVVACAPWQDSG